MKLSTIAITDIDIGKRERSDLGDIDELASSIRERGLICPIAVVEMQHASPERILDSSKAFLLIAGERRIRAHQQLNDNTIAAHVFDRTITELDHRCLELEENIKRKDMSWIERNRAELEIHRCFMSQRGGQKLAKTEEGEGWSVTATAEFLGKDRSGLRKDLLLGEAVELYPALFEKCKNKNEANKLLERIEEKAILSELATRSKQVEGWKQQLIDNYVVRDTFEGMRDLPSGLFHLVEIDPPFNIDYVEGMQQSSASTRLTVHEYRDQVDDYEQFLAQLFKEAHRLLAADGWLLVWFAPEPWLETVYNAITNAGFETDRLVARWYKGQTSGQNNHPDIRLTRMEESFFYARKGAARIIRQGRSNSFDYARPHHSERCHPNEKPVELMRDIYSTFAAPRSRVLVPFAGSGNGLIAAHQLNMEVIGFDKEQLFKDQYAVRVMSL